MSQDFDYSYYNAQQQTESESNESPSCIENLRKIQSTGQLTFYKLIG
jgi:hypothetical protein